MISVMHIISLHRMNTIFFDSWWRHQMETFSAVLAICVGNSPVTGEFPIQRPVTRSFHVSFDLRLNKRLSKQSWGWWFETPSRSLWRHRNVMGMMRHVMGLIRHPSNQPHTFNWRIIPHPLFALLWPTLFFFNRKLQKRHVIYTITTQWKPGVHIQYTHLTYCMHTGQLYLGWKCLLLWLKITFCPMLFLLRAQQNVTTPLELIAKRRRFKTTLLHNNRANTLWDTEGDESPLDPNQPRSPLLHTEQI